jgi:hypothetical protein
MIAASDSRRDRALRELERRREVRSPFRNTKASDIEDVEL